MNHNPPGEMPNHNHYCYARWQAVNANNPMCADWFATRVFNNPMCGYWFYLYKPKLIKKS